MADKDGLQPPASEEWLDRLVHKLRVEHPPKNGGLWSKWSPLAFALIVALFGAFINNNLNSAREDQKKSNERIDNIERTANANANSIDRIDRERSARIAASDAKFESFDSVLRRVPLLESTVARLEGRADGVDGRLDAGRDERVRDRDRMQEVQNKQVTGIALLDQRLQQLEARGRRPDAPPFSPNRSDRPDPFPHILKALYARRLDVGLILKRR